jgi:hypothetical protein
LLLFRVFPSLFVNLLNGQWFTNPIQLKTLYVDCSVAEDDSNVVKLLASKRHQAENLTTLSRKIEKKIFGDLL